jgi:hypothetical protein
MNQPNPATLSTRELFGVDVELPGVTNADPTENPAKRRIREMKERFEARAQARDKAAAEDFGVIEEEKAKVTRFTTDYAVEWGRKQGWKLIERERYDHRTKRHFDLELGVDAIFDNNVDARVGVQGAGKGERAKHRERFEQRGGETKARRRNLHVYYVEFVRGDKTPIVMERWA